jgi:hypothetical protein
MVNANPHIRRMGGVSPAPLFEKKEYGKALTKSKSSMA